MEMKRRIQPRKLESSPCNVEQIGYFGYGWFWGNRRGSLSGRKGKGKGKEERRWARGDEIPTCDAGVFNVAAPNYCDAGVSNVATNFGIFCGDASVECQNFVRR